MRTQVVYHCPWRLVVATFVYGAIQLRSPQDTSLGVLPIDGPATNMNRVTCLLLLFLDLSVTVRCQKKKKKH